MIKQFCLDNPEHEEEVIERCAIMEYSGNIPRRFAEEKAIKLIREKYGLYKQVDWFNNTSQQWEN